VRAGIVNYKDQDWSRVSADAKDLVKKLLTRNAEQRISAEEALNHNWVKLSAPQEQAELPADCLQRLMQFRAMNIVQRAALQIVAGEMTDTAVKRMREIFVSLDTDGSGTLTPEEMKSGIQHAGLELPPNLRQILEGVDADGSGIIDYTEFLAATLDIKTLLSEEVCRQAFSKFDKDGNGSIELTEHLQVLVWRPHRLGLRTRGAQHSLSVQQRRR